MYYQDKLECLSDLFGGEPVELAPDSLRVGARVYPIVDDVIILLAPEHYPPEVARRIDASAASGAARDAAPPIAEDIQYTFGQEWMTYPDIMPEHEDEFRQYFDLLDLPSLGDKRVCDLGCGIGRWSYYLEPHCQQLVLVDFSEAVFVARRNLRHSTKPLFFMGDLTQLPFRRDAMDLVVCLGVLHHLPIDALAALRALAPLASKHLIYLYYALDNRPLHFRLLLALVTALRLGLARIRHNSLRQALCWLGAVAVYQPLIWLGTILKPLGLDRLIPLHDSYHGKSLQRLRQDVYDRFFTRIEQRFSRAQIRQLESTFQTIRISDGLPYWHFLCER